MVTGTEREIFPSAWTDQWRTEKKMRSCERIPGHVELRSSAQLACTAPPLWLTCPERPGKYSPGDFAGAKPPAAPSIDGGGVHGAMSSESRPGLKKWLRDEAPICPHDRLAAAAPARANGERRQQNEAALLAAGGITPGNSWTPPCMFRTRIGTSRSSSSHSLDGEEKG